MNLSNLIDIMKNDIYTLTGSQKIIGSLVVTIISMIIVFIVLIIISFSLNIMNRLISGKKKEESEETKVTENKTHDDKELIAVISAAVASSLETSTNNIIVRNIVRVKDKESNWSKTGRIEQMNSINLLSK